MHPRRMIDWLSRVEDGAPFHEDECPAFCEWLLDEGVSSGAKADCLIALHRRGETSSEIAAFVATLLRHAVDPGIDRASTRGPLVDVCGTGGDRRGLFNVSTATMFVVAGAGASVVKHGNRGITSKCGGADVLVALGVKIDTPPAAAAGILARAGAVFLFAPLYHPAFKAVGEARRIAAERGSRTIFNILGPLLNPARPRFQLAGVFDPSLLGTYAEAMMLLGTESAWIVHGGEGEDELSILAPSRVVTIQRGHRHEMVINPADFRESEPNAAELVGKSAEENAALIRGILDGSVRHSARDMVLLNAAGALTACGIADDLASGLAKASEAVDSGAAQDVLARLQSATADS